ncbi:MAG: aminotransferase class V-fold PLP-dependent enzyme [Acidobacteria bacterium]|nr:aminotransferase class V-fold PLP-dependent enzyme [Acidobacteriota bacterium]
MTDPEKTVLSRFERIHPDIRRRFPMLETDGCGNRRIYLNNGAGTMTVDTAAKVMEHTYRTCNPMPGAAYPAEEATLELHLRTRELIADFLNAPSPDEISFHFSCTNALFNLAYALRDMVRADQNVIVTDLDHMANVSPWEEVFGRGKGCEIRRVPITDEGYLQRDELYSLVDEKTVLFAVTMASNGFGTIVPLKDLIAMVREKSPGCLVCVDAVHHAQHGPIDVRAIGCDFLVFSGYKIFGPMLGLLWGKATVPDTLKPYRVETARNAIPVKFEQGMLPNASLAAMGAALEYLLELGLELADEEGWRDLSRPKRFAFVMNAVAAYERTISAAVLEGISYFSPDRFRCYGITDPGRCEERDPTFAFDVFGRDASDIKRKLWEEAGVQIADGNHYSAAVYRHLERSGLCRASFAHYDNSQTVRFFLEAIRRVMG